jgi:endonuclease YncB( thermonuclease family)|nr:MAG TPA_asm: hypothetical protein [Caudoviricetes sp.]
MEEKQKVQVIFEFDRADFESIMTLKSQEEKEAAEEVWNVMIKEPVVVKVDSLDERDRYDVKVIMVSWAMYAIADRMEE